MSGDRELLTVKEAQHMLGIGRSKAYEMIRRGELPALRMGLVRILAGRCGGGSRSTQRALALTKGRPLDGRPEAW